MRVGSDEFGTEHHLFHLLGLDKGGKHPDAHGAVGDEIHLETELRVVLVSACGKILHAEPVHHDRVGVERLAGLKAVAAPLDLSFAGRRIELGEPLGEEIDGRHVDIVAAEVRCLVHQALGGQGRRGQKQEGAE